MKRASLVSLGLIPMLVATLGMGLFSASAQEATPSAELLAEIGEDGVLTNCIDPSFPPMEFFENQDATEPIGFDIDMMAALAERLGVTFEQMQTEFTGLLSSLESGRCDVIISGIFITPERLETFDAQPYYDSSIVLFTLADNDEIAAPEDLAGKTVAVQAGTTYVTIAEELSAKLQGEGQPAITIQTYPDQTDATQQVVVGRADATITQDTEAAFRASAQPETFRIAYTYPGGETFGIYHRPDATALGAALTTAIEAMRDDGTLAEIAETWGLPVEGTDFSSIESITTPEATPAA
jgi:polar amino acid transport system substrate-binding protein